MKVDTAELRNKVLETLRGRMTVDEAVAVADVLLWADMSGITIQGIVKLIGSEPLQDVVPTGDIIVERDTALSRLINAGGHPAPVVCRLATDVAIDKAAHHGFGMVGVHNTLSSNTTQAFYAERMANEDLIGIVTSSCPASTAPFDSIDPLLGSNPLGFAFPTDGDPLVFDMATSAMTWSGLDLAHVQGENLSPNSAIDHDGNATADPLEAMRGALLPFDHGYKGAGLGLVVEVLAGPLVRAAYCDQTWRGEWGSLFIAFDPGLLVDVGDFKRQCSDLMRTIKESRTRSGAGGIRLPGERATACRRTARETGTVDIEDAVLHELGYVQPDGRWRDA
jgi:LDH2 family malate/lactate/ureidoglycolate dehydrogenase